MREMVYLIRRLSGAFTYPKRLLMSFFQRNPNFSYVNPTEALHFKKKVRVSEYTLSSRIK